MKSWKMYCTGLGAGGRLSNAMGQGLPAITPPPGLASRRCRRLSTHRSRRRPCRPTSGTSSCPRADQKAACKAKICNSPIGQLLNNMLSPAGAMTGGIIGPFCPTISAADLAKPPDSAEGAAARLKVDEADAAARRAAIRYMAGADCHYWPEVTEALIGALRADRNECVRLEAALALGRGCCCNRATMLALTLTVSGSTADGNPAETPSASRRGAGGAEPLPGQLHRGRPGPRGADQRPRRREDPAEAANPAAETGRTVCRRAQTANDAERSVRPDRVLSSRRQPPGKERGGAGPSRRGTRDAGLRRGAVAGRGPQPVRHCPRRDDRVVQPDRHDRGRPPRPPRLWS